MRLEVTSNLSETVWNSYAVADCLWTLGSITVIYGTYGDNMRGVYVGVSWDYSAEPPVAQSAFLLARRGKPSDSSCSSSAESNISASGSGSCLDPLAPPSISAVTVRATRPPRRLRLTAPPASLSQSSSVTACPEAAGSRCGQSRRARDLGRPTERGVCFQLRAGSSSLQRPRCKLHLATL